MSNTRSRQKMGSSEDCFFAPPESFDGDRITIKGSEARHISVVIRRRQGDIVAVIDGRGGRYKVELIDCTAEMIVGRVIGKEEFSPDLPELWIAPGIIKSNRMDLLVEKCTELGAAVIVPVSTKRSLSSKTVSDLKLTRWQRISTGAMTQSSRVFLPRVCQATSLEELFRMAGDDSTLLFAHSSGKSMHLLRERDLSRKRIVACIGPEGDFTQAELEFLIKSDAIPVSLGRVRLRAETAAMAVLDRLNFIFERPDTGPRPSSD